MLPSTVRLNVNVIDNIYTNPTASDEYMDLIRVIHAVYFDRHPNGLILMRTADSQLPFRIPKNINAATPCE